MHSDETVKGGNGMQRFFARVASRAALPYLALGSLLLIAIVVAGRDIHHHINAIESWIAHLGPWGVLAFVRLFVLATSLLLPDTVLCIIAGALFGLAWGGQRSSRAACWPGRYSSRWRANFCGRRSSGRWRPDHPWRRFSVLSVGINSASRYSYVWHR